MPDPIREHWLTVAAVEAEANDTLCVEFAVPAELTGAFCFKQGQYVTLSVDCDGDTLRRSYSICAALGEPLRVAIKKIEGGAFSQYAHANFRAGTRVKVREPEGSFTSPLHPENKKSYLCIAAGSGITPIISIVKSVLAEEPDSRVTLLYGNRRSADIIFREQLLWLKNRYLQRLQWINVFSQEKQGAPVLNGRINNRKGAELNRHLLDLAGYDEFFLCGPEGMTSEVARGLRDFGVDEARIHYELFFASAEDARAALQKQRDRIAQYAGLTTQVRVRAGGREVQFELSADGENILDGAMNSGVDLPFSCKGGVCATCKAKVLEGTVDMDLNHALSAEELAEGFVLTCQAHPISDNVIIDFDVI
ncbi:MAG: 2Fe-2S iron-sulfur cluster-binding protein [Pseudomonadota bacterium]